MLFNETVIKNKQKHLDAILKNESVLRKLLNCFSEGQEYEYSLVKRPWDPGGGSTLFSLQVGRQRYFLKVKRCKVFVESKLEAEESFTDIPSLRNEYHFFQRVKDISANTPKFFKYVEEDGFSFLFIEHLLPLKDVVGNFNAKELLEVYEQIKSTVRHLYENSIVHTDIHENNIMFRGNIPVLIDFEEARVLLQEVPFEESLDVAGENAWGNIGRMPEGHGFIDGYTCLNRLKKEFEKLILSKLDDLIKKCNFDSSCPFLNALDHGKDERIYQSINLPGYSIEGQRPLFDDRIDFILRTTDTLFQEAFTHLDIGSNLGRFNIEISKSNKVKKSIGIEAYDKYVDLAKILAFLSNSSNVEFIKAECGKDSLSELLSEEKIDFVTLYSVYHHIENKKTFIEDLIRLNPSYIMFEMPMQKECYGGKFWEEEISLISQEMEMPYWYLLTESNDYKRPIVLVSKTEVSKKLSRTTDTSSASPTKSFLSTLRGQPQVSVVLPTYNHLRFLPKAVESVLRQTFSDFELIIVNDGSTDGTREYLVTLKDPRIRIIHQKNNRLPEALNTGFRAARGDLLTWISADNYCAPMFLEKFVSAMDANPKAGLAYSAFARIDEHDQITKVTRCPNIDYHCLLLRFPGMASFMYRRICQEKVGLYDPALEGTEDWDMWLRIIEQFPFVYVSDVLYYYRQHEKSLTYKKSNMIAKSSLQVFQNAINRLRMESLYPSLEYCKDRTTAEFHACFDFGTALIRSRYGLQTGAIKFLEKAFSLRPDSLEATSNLAVACALSGQWEKTVPLLKTMQKTENLKVLNICRDIIEAYQAQKADSLLSTDLFEVDKNNSELFQSGQGRGRDLFHEAKTTPETWSPGSIDGRSSGESALGYFIKAGEELNKENFSTAIEYMQQYRSMIDYSRFPRILNKSRKRGEIDVSVIIVTYNRVEDLKSCLESLSKQDDANYEVIVVDNGGSDFEVFQQYVNQYIKCPINFILSEGRNIGACCAKGKIIAFLDDDALVPPNYISSIKSAFDQYDIFGLRGKAHPKSSSNANNHLNIYDLGDRPFPSYCNQEGNSAWLLEVYKSMDGMDPLLFGHEGSDLTFRIIKEYKQPNKIIYWPNTIIYHDYGTADKLRLKKRIHQRNANYLKYKHKTDIFVNRTDIEKYPLPLKQTQVLPDKASSTPEGSIFQPTRCARQPVKPSELPKVKYPNTVSAASTSHLHPRVSIVISCYNCENFLPECLDSIRNQTMNDWELFLLDDASTDGTRSIIEKYAQIDERIKPYYFRDNRGPYVRRNFAIERANSDFIVIQDADDIMYLPKLEILYNEIAKDERLEVVGSFYRMCLEQSKGLEYADKIELPITHDEIMQQYSLKRYVCWHGSAIIRKSMFEQIGLYDENPYGSDKFWLAKAAEYARCSNEVRFKNVPEYLTLKREHSSSQQGLLPTLDTRSRRARFQTYWEYKLLKIREKLNNNPDVDIKAELRNCKCNDYIKRYGCLFEQWESQPLDNIILCRFISRGVRKFNEGKYVRCIIILDSVEKILNDVTKRFKYYDLLRAMAYFAINMKQECLRYLNREIENHNNTAARKFISDYFENQLKTSVRDWCRQNSKFYNLQMVDIERKSGAQQENSAVSEQYIPAQQDEPKEIQKSSSCGQTCPLVSVIMPAYNAADYIKKAIESILIQNYKNFELLIINDGSTDNTEEAVLGFKDEKIRYFRQENRGLAATHNVGIKKSSGEFIIKLDSDDMMMPDFIARHLQEFEKHPDADLVYCNDCLIDENSKAIRVIERPEYTDRKLLIRDLFRCGFPVVPFRTCIRRSVFDKIGFFDEELLVGEDYDMMRRFVKHGLKIHHLKGALYLRRMTSNSLSRNYSAQKAKSHFEVVKRFTDTFTHDELFPDVAWDEIAPQIKQLHAKCLAAGTYLAIGQDYVKTKAVEYSRTAFDKACSELNDCVKMNPENQELRQLLQKSELIRARYTEAPQQVVSK